MARGLPVFLHVCDHQGECIRVKPGFSLTIQGSVIEIPLRDLEQFTDAMTQAGDELVTYELPGRHPGPFAEPM